ncbi:HAMP domain-containing histidine kinase [Caenimonas sedimenti]|uniref:histidine kinase n=1 Tax=Caenimonas sedimenti TaxID=2596921 RepID=A0A562ZWE6_9BURK|nr:HAMP domain-containing sensor histidine kinase [Caenimonas sedimenti]TWO72615.1 HAMP domain-containing histidine kinase [Caenimonas sedimenti]
MPEASGRPGVGEPRPRPQWHRRVRHGLRHTVKARLVALFLLLALGMTGAFLFGTQRALTVGWRDAARPLVSDYVDRLAAEIGSPPSRDRARSLAERLPVRIRITGPELRWQSGDFEDDDEHRYWNRRDEHGREVSLLARTTADGHRIEFGVDTRPWRSRPRIVGWATLAVLLGLTALAYAYVRRLLRPLDDIRDGARRFGDGEFTKAIPIRRRDELGELAGDINAMASSLHGMLEAKRTLLLAISHELRSPITRARLHTELLPEGGEGGLRKEALLRDLAEMSTLVTDLLESERLGAGHAALQLADTDLAALAAEVVAALAATQPDAPPVTLDVTPGLPMLRLDPTRIRLLLRNLLANALRHGAGETPPVLRILHGPGEPAIVALSVRDHGPAVDAAALPHLGEPFWRPDSARERATGGAGLGLYLCRLVAQAHGGRMVIRLAEPGLEVLVTLPIPKVS